MQFKNIVVAATLAASAAALPAASTTEKTTFSVVAIDSGSDVQYSAFGATKGSLLAGLTSQNATCDGSETINYATFYIDNGHLILYNDGSSTSQEFFVDASGMGGGVIQYTHDILEAITEGSVTGWAINDEHLQYGGKDLIACPNSIQGAWSIWADAGVSNPGGNTDCVGIGARVTTVSSPSSCVYTE